MLKETLAKFAAMIKGTNDDATRALLENLQKSLEYCIEENNILRETLREKLEGKRLRLNQEQRKRLSAKAIRLDRRILQDVANIFQPATILGWYRKEVGRKYDRHGGKHNGPAPIPTEWEAIILKMAKSNPTWGYGRIAGYMVYLKHNVSASTVKRVLDAHGLTPCPDTRKHVDWAEFIAAHKDIIAATDFVTVETVEQGRLERYHALFFIKIGSRKVELGGIGYAPCEPWMMQVGRNVTDCEDGFLNGQKYLIHDCDTLFTDKFKKLMTGSGITTKKTRPHCPNMNAYIERFIQSIEVECLDKLILTSEDQLRYVVKEYLEYYNCERPHQGLGGQFINPHPQDEDGEIREFIRFGGLLKSYRRVSTKNPAYFHSNPLFEQDKAA